ncbi:hypothetical protein QE152_g11320 [Popillia japonica]|uniref:Uncharacterized protein n=1 Tax=Popillia japonica TaxID=7064 RepID=A0AAW1LLT4_POPJA
MPPDRHKSIHRRAVPRSVSEGATSKYVASPSVDIPAIPHQSLVYINIRQKTVCARPPRPSRFPHHPSSGFQRPCALVHHGHHDFPTIRRPDFAVRW